MRERKREIYINKEKEGEGIMRSSINGLINDSLFLGKKRYPQCRRIVTGNVHIFHYAN